MKLHQLQKIQGAIENFFYKVRVNIALHNILHNPKYSEFCSRVQAALQKQILYFAKIEKVNSVVKLQKAVKKLTNKDLLKELKKMWIPVTTFLMIALIEDYLRWVAEKSGQIALNKLKTEKKFELKEKRLLTTIKNRAKELPRLIDKTTQDWIARTIEEGLKNKLSNYEIAKLIREAAKRTATERAELIAENEAALMLGELEMEVYKRNNIKYKKWITQRDELTCPSCIANEEAGEISIDEVFPSGHLASPAHYRCRCFILPILPEKLEIKWTG